MTTERRYRAGETIEDVCRACKADRLHTVIVADANGRPLRVMCDYCRSEHNFRGGPADRTTGRAPAPRPQPVRPAGGNPFPLVSERERVRDPVRLKPDATNPVRLKPDSTNDEVPAQPMHAINADDLETLLRRIIREEAGVTPVVPSPKWRGGTLVLRPGSPGLQEKSWPIETFFHKVVMVRNRLRTLEQQVNASELPDDVKVRLQAYVSGCYGSLTSFNVLFADDEDQFKGGGGSD